MKSKVKEDLPDFCQKIYLLINQSEKPFEEFFFSTRYRDRLSTYGITVDVIFWKGHRKNNKRVSIIPNTDATVDIIFWDESKSNHGYIIRKSFKEIIRSINKEINLEKHQQRPSKDLRKFLECRHKTAALCYKLENESCTREYTNGRRLKRQHFDTSQIEEI